LLLSLVHFFLFAGNIRDRSVPFRKPGRPDALTGSNHSTAAVGSSSNNSNSRGGQVHNLQQGSAMSWRAHSDKNELIYTGKSLYFDSSSQLAWKYHLLCYNDLCFDVMQALQTRVCFGVDFIV
jgi:hypothetical protein